MSVPTRMVTDKTTLFERRSWTKRQDTHANNADPRPEIVAVTDAEKRVLFAAKQYLSDYKTHRLSVLYQSAAIKGVIADLKIPRSKVRHMLKNVPNQIMFRDADNGEAYLALVLPGRDTQGNSANYQSAILGDNQRQSQARKGASEALFEPMSSTDEEDDDDADSVPVASTSNHPAASTSAWGIQRPRDQQKHKQSIPSSSPAKPMPFRSSVPRRSVTAERDGRHTPDQVDDDDGSDLLSAIRNSQSLKSPSRDPERSTERPPLVSDQSQRQNGEMRTSAAAQQPQWVDGREPASASFSEPDLKWGEEITAPSSSSTRPILVDLSGEEEDDFDLDMPLESEYTRRSGSKRSHQKTSSGGGSTKRDMPAIIFDGHSASRSRGKSTVPMPPGLDDDSTRDSSQQDGESTGDDLEANGDQKPKLHRGGPTKPGTVRKSRSRDDDDDDSDDDVIVVTSVRVGSAPSKTPQEREAEREEKRREREERRAAREAERLEKEKLHERRRRNPLPNFRHTQEQEMLELTEVYKAYLMDLHDRKTATMADSSHGTVANASQMPELDAEAFLETLASAASEQATWSQCFSYESGKGRVNRPDYSSVQFWPYNLPFPGRRRNEAIVAVTGGCVVRVLRLSEGRGVSELWNAVDESSGWENENLQEDYFSCVWTHELREDPSVSPTWRKWPILCLAGRAKEVKILDGYSGTLLKVLQGHGGPIHSLVVHPTLPHIVATASADEVISLWDISVPVAKPEIEAATSVLEEKDKRRKGYAEDERLCVFGGFGGHIEAILSIDIHPSLPLLASVGADCKVRVWKLPNDLPSEPASALTDPQPIDLPEKTRRPPSFAFPIFTQDTLHSHHIDHVQWIGHQGHLLTRSLCFDGPGKRVIRIFRPKFFDTLADPDAQPLDTVGFDISFPPDTELLARWTTPPCTDGIGDGLVHVSTELEKEENGKLSSKRRVYIPTLQPGLHVYDIDISKKQHDLADLLQKYPIKLGTEMLFEEDLHRKRPWRAVACQAAGRGWLVAVGEGEKLSIWKRKPLNGRLASTEDVRKMLRKLDLIEEGLASDSPEPNGVNVDEHMAVEDHPQDELPTSIPYNDRQPTPPSNDTQRMEVDQVVPASVVTNGVPPIHSPVIPNGVHDAAPQNVVVTRSPSVEYL